MAPGGESDNMDTATRDAKEYTPYVRAGSAMDNCKIGSDEETAKIVIIPPGRPVLQAIKATGSKKRGTQHDAK